MMMSQLPLLHEGRTLTALLLLVLLVPLATSAHGAVRLDRLALGPDAPQNIHVTNTDIGAIVRVHAVLHHHGTHASVLAAGYVDAGASRALPLDAELLLVTGCNLISVIDEAAGIRELVRVCRLPSGRLVSQATLTCAAHEWADNAHLCAARLADECAAVCCACEAATPRPTCCLAQRNVTQSFEWRDALAVSAYNNTDGATDWSYAPWSETQPADDGLPDRGRITVAIGGPGMRLSCAPQPAAPLSTNVGCLFGLGMGVARAIYTPPCLDGRTLTLALMYAGENATLRVTGASGALVPGCPNVTLALPSSLGPRAIALNVTACADGLLLALHVPVAPCDTRAHVALYTISVTGACAPREIPVALPIDACGVCGGNTTQVSACTIGTYLLFLRAHACAAHHGRMRVARIMPRAPACVHVPWKSCARCSKACEVSLHARMPLRL